MPTPDLLPKVGKEILDARMNHKYHALREDFLVKVDWGAKILAALTGSAAIASFKFWKDPAGQDLWLAFTFFAAVVNAVTAVFSPAERARKHASLRQRWSGLRYSWEALETDLEHADVVPISDALQRYERLREERGRIEAEQTRPWSRHLTRAQREVLREIGADKANLAPTRPVQKELADRHQGGSEAP